MSNQSIDKIQFELTPNDKNRLARLSGQMNQHFHMIEKELSVAIFNRGNLFEVSGNSPQVIQARSVLENLYNQSENADINPDVVHLALCESGAGRVIHNNKNIVIETKRGLISGKGENQQRYLQRIFSNAVNFGVGPAGTGKTYLAVAAAVGFLAQDKVSKIILVRPAVEAGERLGFLPGDMAQKVDPYLRPLYDALYDLLGIDRVGKLIERGVIEIAPLAFMRGRTLNGAFIILDEAQNTTSSQMKMFLTRQGFGSTAVITGDSSQRDLPKNIESGLDNALKVLKDVEGISVTHFTRQDVVRHPLVQKIIKAYENNGNL